jgi:hypothetical protein
MGTTARHNHQNTKKLLTSESKKKTTSNRQMVDLSNDPYFVKKAEDAKKLLDKYGTPKK